MAATICASRVAEEHGEVLVADVAGRASIGYAVKDELALPYSRHSIVYVIEEKLLKSLRQGYFTHFILDEAHERRETADMLLMLWREERMLGKVRPKLVVMTTKVDRSFFVCLPGCAVEEVEVAGRGGEGKNEERTKPKRRGERGIVNPQKSQVFLLMFLIIFIGVKVDFQV